MPETFDFAVSGINHAHIYGQVDAMLGAGCRLIAFHAPEDDLAAEFAKKYPQAARVADERAIIDDPAVRLVVGAGIPSERAGVALRAMRAGKDAMVDKPGCTTEAQLAELRRVQAETGRIFSICYSEHYLQPSTVAAARLVAEGRIGRVVSTIGLGPHRVGLHARPDWFWDTARGGAILVDIASHQFEQFLALHRLDRRPRPLRRRGELRPPRPRPLVRLRPRHRRLRPRHGLHPRRLADARRAPRSGATAASSSSAPRAPSSSASTSTSRAARAATISS